MDEADKRSSDTATPEVYISWIGGNCPVQAEGRIDGHPFYFRSRGEHWSLLIGGDPPRWCLWEYAAWYGEWPSAGWITQDEARAFIAKGVSLWWEAMKAEGNSKLDQTGDAT